MSDKVSILEKDSGTVGHRQSRSVLFPILLIGGGLLLLLSNLGFVSGLNWVAAFSLWPLFLIFLGLDLLLRQAAPSMGTLFSALLALVAIGLFGYVLFSGNPVLGLGAGRGATELRQETFELPASNVETADITLDLANSATQISALTGDMLIAGTIFTRGDLRFDTAVEDGRAEVTVGEENAVWSFNPADWFRNEPGREWQINLNPNVPTNLKIDIGNASASAGLEDLTLTALEVEGGNGSLSATLPPGEYEVMVDSGNGSMRLDLPASGQQTMRIDGGNGSVSLSLPANVAARVEYNEGNGSVSVDDRFTRVSGDADEGIYETADYASATDRITLDVNTGNGSFSISRP